MSRYNDPDDVTQPPEDLTRWLAAGLRRTEALAWRKWNFTLEEAMSWRGAGVREALTAAQWQVAGVGPKTVREWITARITVGEAIRWHEYGFDLDQAREHTRNGRTPDDVYNQRRQITSFNSIIGRAATVRADSIGGRIQAFLNAGVPHGVMGGYLQTQWTDDTALAWSRQGIQAWDARMWEKLGLTPAEAGELAKAGNSAADVWSEWWQSGIPFEEVADWIGAGLSAREAVEQRASGVTQEQAAALRALRRGGAL